MIRSLTFLLAVVVISGCTNLSGKSPAEQRADILAMKQEVLTELFKQKPSTESMLKSAAGYAVFDNGNVNIFVLSVGGGYGVVKDNANGQHIYMKMAEAGVGLGLGVKNFRAVMVFHSRKALDRFIEHGWQAGAHADAAAKAGDQGVAVTGEAVADNITVYTFTEAGLALQAQIKGVKFWKDSELN